MAKISYALLARLASKTGDDPDLTKLSRADDADEIEEIMVSDPEFHALLVRTFKIARRSVTRSHPLDYQDMGNLDINLVRGLRIVEVAVALAGAMWLSHRFHSSE
ncbi:MAG: hypothetical protein ACHQUB_01400 [Candidatus Saccharimonadia bacterium]